MPFPLSPPPVTPGMCCAGGKGISVARLRCTNLNVLHLTRNQKVGSEASSPFCILTSEPLCDWSEVTAARRAALTCSELSLLPRGNSSVLETERHIHNIPFPGNAAWGEDGVKMFPLWEGWPWGSSACCFPCCFPEPSLSRARREI